MVDRATGEVRFAVVLYGGVSLAIYMNGIAQELLRMVRGSSDLPDAELLPGELIYRDLSRALAGPDGGRTRFVIDIISGTSAGGINGVALAKALVVGSPDMDVLRKAWTDKADIGLLLNDRASVARRFRLTESLLDGGHMYDVLHETIAKITGNGTPLAEMVDLFVTATDLNGRPAPIHLTGARLDEKIYKTVFHFAYDGAREGCNDFRPENDAALAFAARCTSSFPVAFPPMRFADMPKAAQDSFPGDWPHRDRVFADGGYLDNRPFSHAIGMIPFRPTTLPGERKLIFVDPFPDDPMASGASPLPAPIDFLQNAKLAASTLPRTEVIREDIRAITRMNRRLERLGTLQARWDRDREQAASRDEAMKEPEKPDNVEQMDLVDLIKDGYGNSYPLYHHLRVYDTTDSLTGIVARLAGYDPDSDEALYLRQLLRAWRDAHFTAYHDATGRELESAFLSRHDIGFRLRRLIYLRAEIDRQTDQGKSRPPLVLRAARDLVERMLAATRRLAVPLQVDAEKLLTLDEIAVLTARISQEYGAAMQLATLQQRYLKAQQIYRDPQIGPLIDTALGRLGENMRDNFSASSATIREGLTLLCLPDLLQVYDAFHWHDVSTYPFLEGSELQEHSEVQVFRVSPADSGLNPRPSKLAGIAVGAFGGFLNRDWREHDILWGRLDGAERIVAALMADRPETERKLWTDRFQNQILLEEFGEEQGKGRRLALLRAKLRDAHIDEDAVDDTAAQALGVKDAAALDLARFGSYYKDLKPLGPRAPEIAGWSSRSMAILSRMIDDLPDDGILRALGGRAASALRAGGGLMSGFARFAMPGTYWRMFADNILYLAVLAGVMVLVLSPWLGQTAPGIGAALIGVSVWVWLLLYSFGRWLRGNKRAWVLLRWFLVLVALALMIVGAVTVANYLRR